MHKGATDRARELLIHGLTQAGDDVPADDVTFLMLRLLGQATRQLGDLRGAAAVYHEAQALARDLDQPMLESAAVEGLAIVARADEDVELAIDLYGEAARLAGAAGDEVGRATVLSNEV